ncbi:Pathogenesis-related thaumatin superfamily protein [Abeliophyllum distichum]|uniref:Pathogenesis-related thaumatin superfamily protein n=1 Tax=Abeliophyllum distichum TaxID=126358 RepID=A0ABD1RQD8_9LAMI
MDLFSISSSFHILTLYISFILFCGGALGATFTFVNKCEYTVWPGILANAGSPSLDSSGFELSQDTSRSFNVPTGWSGRMWARTGCTFDESGSGSCTTADCGSGQVECNGAGASPPATLAEFTLGTGGQDFYDVSLVDGYNLPMIVETSGGSGMCASTGCVTDLNRVCPSELRVGGGEACKSACEAFGSPEYCCSGAFNSPTACKPSVYAQMFKSVCPRSYSYAYDDPTSTFTCAGADYTVTFCPSMPSQKSSKDPTPTTTAPVTTTDGSISGSTDGSISESGTTGTDGTETGSGLGVTGSDPDSESGSGSQATLADGSWLAGLAMGDSNRVYSSSALHSALIALVIFIFSIISL